MKYPVSSIFQNLTRETPSRVDTGGTFSGSIQMSEVEKPFDLQHLIFQPNTKSREIRGEHDHGAPQALLGDGRVAPRGSLNCCGRRLYK